MRNKILIVDDEMVTRESLKKLLAPYGKCEIADSGEKALLAFQEAQEKSEPYTLMTLDIDMPGMNGMEVLKSVRELESIAIFPKKRKLRIIMISAVREVEQNLLKSYFLDSEEYIVKPATKEKLLRSLTNMDIEPEISQS